MDSFYESALSDHAIPLDTTDPDADRSDLTTVVDTFADADIIGLGEATHGTREFFQLKDRIVRSLVTDADLRLFALEANFSETLAINEYIMEGEGSPIDALEGIYFWTWDTEEVLALIEWLCAFNEGRPPTDQVKFYGLDMQYTTGAARALDNYLEVVDSEFHAQHTGTLEMLTEMDFNSNDDDKMDACLSDADRFVAALSDRFTERESAYVDGTTRDEYELAVQHHRTLEQALAAKHAVQDDDVEAQIRIRDRAMAENASWILDYESHDTMVLWAHNAHIRRGTVEGDAWDDVCTVGAYLDEEYGEDYFALGFNFARGHFQAKVERDDETYPLEECYLGEPRDGSITEILARVDEPLFFLNIEECVRDELLAPIFTENREIRTAGALYYGSDNDEHYETVVVGEVYDGLIFVTETQRAVPIKRE